MNRYATYFDKNYLAQGVALWRSLIAYAPDAHLTVLALDAETEHVLRAQSDQRLEVLSLGTLLAADAQLAVASKTRQRREFIFSLTPCFMSFLLERVANGACIMYLDADLFFFSSPAPIWRELGGASILAVPHRYPEWHDDAAWFGKFNVGVVVLRADVQGRDCGAWWRDRCLDSTELTADGSCYGDQKYLDEWPKRFRSMVEMTHPGVNAAPWNWARFQWRVLQGGSVTVDGAPLVVFHFAQFKRVSEAWFDSGQLEYGVMPRSLRTAIYGPYWRALLAAERRIQEVNPSFAISRAGWGASLGPLHLAVLRLASGQFWWHRGSGWWSGRAGLGQFSGRVLAMYRRWQRRAL